MCSGETGSAACSTSITDKLHERVSEPYALVGQGPGTPAAPGPAVAQQELAQPMAGAGPVLDHVGPGPAQVPDRFFLNSGDADRYQFSGPVQPRQPAAVPTVGLDLVASVMPEIPRANLHLTTVMIAEHISQRLSRVGQPTA